MLNLELTIRWPQKEQLNVPDIVNPVVFQNGQQNLAPPGKMQDQPDMAMWLQMKLMMADVTTDPPTTN